MTTTREIGRFARLAGRALRFTSVLVLSGGMAACNLLDDALDVETPSQVPASLLDDPQFANLLVTGLIADFECAFGSFVMNSALLGDELYDATFTANRWPVPSRQVQPSDARYATFGCETLGAYTPISTARWSADNALGKLEGWTDAQVENRQQRIAIAAAYSGYSHIMLAELFCTSAIDLSGELTSQEVFTRAEAKFTRAIEAAQAAQDQQILNLARVGRARARLALGNTQGAAADAELVPVGFEHMASASSVAARRRNRVNEETRLSIVSVKEPYRNLTVDGVADARVPVLDAGRNGSDAQTPLFQQRKYTDDAQALPIATWREAKLIVAEARGGQDAVDAINAIRDHYDLPALAGTPTADQILEERRRTLFLEGHRIWDIRRFNLDQFPAPGTPFSKGGQYQDRNCLPLPDVERASNPNLPR